MQMGVQPRAAAPRGREPHNIYFPQMCLCPRTDLQLRRIFPEDRDTSER